MNDGGHLRGECRDAWAQCYVRFIQAYAAEGVPIWGVSVQNEPDGRAALGLVPLQRRGRARLRARPPWPSVACRRPGPREDRRLGPQPRPDGRARPAWSTATPKPPGTSGAPASTGTAKTTSTTCSRCTTPGPTSSCCSPKAARKAARTGAAGRWPNATRRSIINDLNRWTVGWIDWNLLLTSRAAPTTSATSAARRCWPHAGRRCLHAAELVRGLGHFARFIRPGARSACCARPRARRWSARPSPTRRQCRGGGAQPQRGRSGLLAGHRRGTSHTPPTCPPTPSPPICAADLAESRR
jgi:glucosylceramidase